MSFEMAESSNTTSKRHVLGASTKFAGTCQRSRIHPCSQAPLARKALFASAPVFPATCEYSTSTSPMNGPTFKQMQLLCGPVLFDGVTETPNTVRH